MNAFEAHSKNSAFNFSAYFPQSFYRKVSSQIYARYAESYAKSWGKN